MGKRFGFRIQFGCFFGSLCLCICFCTFVFIWSLFVFVSIQTKAQVRKHLLELSCSLRYKGTKKCWLESFFVATSLIFLRACMLNHFTVFSHRKQGLGTRLVFIYIAPWRSYGGASPSCIPTVSNT